MDLRIVWAVLLSILPISELRGGLPLAVIYANENGISIIFIFLLIVLCNIVGGLIAFYFLDRIHVKLLGLGFYKRIFESYIGKIQKKVDKFESKYSLIGFLALTLFVAIPLPATGAWSGALISWLLDLDRKKSVLAISCGVIIAGVLVLLGTLGVLGFFSVLN